jgi:hypothetical protein
MEFSKGIGVKTKLNLLKNSKSLFSIEHIRLLGFMKSRLEPLLIPQLIREAFFVAALKANASGVVVAHNHSSGNLNPSQSDIELTKDCETQESFCTFSFLITLLLPAGSIFRSQMKGSCSPSRFQNSFQKTHRIRKLARAKNP